MNALEVPPWLFTLLNHLHTAVIEKANENKGDKKKPAIVYEGMPPGAPDWFKEMHING